VSVCLSELRPGMRPAVMTFSFTTSARCSWHRRAHADKSFPRHATRPVTRRVTRNHDDNQAGDCLRQTNSNESRSHPECRPGALRVSAPPGLADAQRFVGWKEFCPAGLDVLSSRPLM
jgi:hypothetical protein